MCERPLESSDLRGELRTSALPGLQNGPGRCGVSDAAVVQAPENCPEPRERLMRSRGNFELSSQACQFKVTIKIKYY